MSWFQSRLVRRLVFIGLLTLFATWLALPASLPVKFRLGLWQVGFFTVWQASQQYSAN